MAKGIDLTTTYMGVQIKNPIIIGAGPTTATPEICEKAAKLGDWAGVVLKTHYGDDVHKVVPLTIPRPYYGLTDSRGTGKWKPIVPKVGGPRTRGGKLLGRIQPDYSLTMWGIRTPAPFEKRTGYGLYFQGPERYTYYTNKTKELVENTGCKVIASITAFTEQWWEEQMKIINGTKADMVELNFGCPSVGAIDKDATGGEWVAVAMGAFPSIVEKWTKYCVPRIKNIPVGVKLPPYAPLESVQAAVRSGAKGVQFGDAPLFVPSRPPLMIDVDKAQPGTYPGMPFTTGAMFFSTSTVYICGAMAEFRTNGVEIDISGCGGVREPLDIIRILMAGATSAQVCTATMIEGVEVGKEYLEGITQWMEKKGHKSVKELIGIAATKEKLRLDLSKAPKVGLPQIISGVMPEEKIVVDKKKCISCNWCESCCFHLAIKMENEKPNIDRKLCEVCGMCVAVCPMGALSIE